ncbi:MAG: ferrous iron transport protein A [Clostridia bacterium]|nr:ferrous iron transport protein A [Clostridia bacterium]
MQLFEPKNKVDIRLVHLGFTKGTVLQVVGKSFANQTVAIKIRGSVLCLRKDVANKIFVRCI